MASEEISLLTKAKVMIGTHLGELAVLVHKGEAMLVVFWFANSEKTLRRPEYVIPMARLRHQHFPNSPDGCDYFVNDALPEQLVDRAPSPELQKKFHVIRGPNIELPVVRRTIH